MNSRADYNPAAFPQPQGEEQEGMTLRDYFAAKAMQALTYWACPAPPYTAASPSNMDLSYDETAEMAYEQADAMLKARQS